MKSVKFLLYNMMGALVLFSACNPTKDFEDAYDSIKKTNDSTLYAQSNKTKLNDTITVYQLKDADYAKSSVSTIKSNKNFSDAYPVKTYLPEILNNLYIAKSGAQVKIKYNYYNPLTLKDSVSYSMVDADYPDQKYKNFNAAADILTYLSSRYPGATRGKVVILSCKVNKITPSPVTYTFVYLGTEWIQVNVLALGDYKSMMGQQSYADFTDVSTARYDIPLFLKNPVYNSANTAYPALYTTGYAKSGDKMLIQYALYQSSKTTQKLLLLTYDGVSWNIVDDVVSAIASCTFTGTSWSFVPPLAFSLTTTETATRSYTLVASDYTYVGNQYADFERTGTEKDDNVLLTKIGKILQKNFSDIAAGQVFAVTFYDYSSKSNITVNVKVNSAN